MVTRNSVRHRQFIEQVDMLAIRFSRVHEVIDGAVWEISKDPETNGVYVAELDVWAAKLDMPPQVILVYSFNRRFVHLMTIVLASRSVL